MKERYMTGGRNMTLKIIKTLSSPDTIKLKKTKIKYYTVTRSVKTIYK